MTDISQSPTLTEEMTRAGVILGTAAYMSPEQAKGNLVDKRTDIFAFGSVLYELLTGKRAFGGETITETIAAVLKSDPDWEALPGNTPWRIQELLRRCLTKDVHDRLDGIANVRIEIRLALSEPATLSPIGVGGAVQFSVWRRAIPLVGTALLAALLSGTAVWNWSKSPELSPGEPFRLMVEVSPDTRLSRGELPAFALSPDGRRLVYSAASVGEPPHLYVRSLDRFEAVRLPGTEGASYPFFSPDSEWVGFLADGKLQKTRLSGGMPQVICEVPAVGFGAAWSEDDTILFSSTATFGLFRVPASGGVPQSVSVPDLVPLFEGSQRLSQSEIQHLWPEALPGGRTALFTISKKDSPDQAQLAALSLDTGQWRTISERGAYSRYSPTGHLIYGRSGMLMAVPFDLEKLETSGEPVTILRDIERGPGGAAQFSISADGTLAYLPRRKIRSSKLVLVDREGRERLLIEDRRELLSPRVSPDGKRVAVTVVDGAERNIWIYEMERGVLVPLTFESQNSRAVWTPDGRRLVFSSNRTGSWNLFSTPADRRGEAEQLAGGSGMQYPASCSSRGVLAYSEGSSVGNDIWLLPLESEAKPYPLLATEFNERHSAFSPDDRWVALTSNRSGRDEVYVVPWGDPGGITPISSGGGSQPVWARNGRELFFRSGDKLMVVSIQTEAFFHAGTPAVLFETLPDWDSLSTTNYDLGPGGEGFIMVEIDEGGSRSLIYLVLNWFEELKTQVR
ncbi:protein kinase [Acidobacteria bacterium AH-259-A15]|nr:protein kinase [Acidobacteria bacterium AH-259-A15]